MRGVYADAERALPDAAPPHRLRMRVAVHVRRTDKAGPENEAIIIALEHYAAAACEGMRRWAAREAKRRGAQPRTVDVVVFLTSDNETMHEPFARELDASISSLPFEVNANVTFHYSPGRPERWPGDSEITFHRLMEDLRLFVDADVFVGTQSSNYGIVACLLRGGDLCMSVEAPAPRFEWRLEVDKMVR